MHHRRTLLVATAALAVLAAPARAAELVTERVSVSSAGVEANDFSFGGALSADGRFVAFGSRASNLVPGDTNGAFDAFVRDRQAGTTERVSVTSAEAQAGGGIVGDISADGSVVLFDSIAADLVDGDTNAVEDVFVRDRQAGTTERVSVSSTGAQANGRSFGAQLSADGRLVFFGSFATNLDPSDEDIHPDAFVHDRLTGATELVTRGGFSSTGPFDISADGRFLGFTQSPEAGTSGVAVFVYDRQTNVLEQVAASDNVELGLSVSGTSLSADARFVAFDKEVLVTPDGPVTRVSFVFDRQTGTTERVSVDSAGAPANDDSFFGRISADGRLIAFGSNASNLVADDTNAAPDVFVRDRQAGTTVRVSESSAGEQANGSSAVGWPNISADGSVVSFASVASNLVAGDTNGVTDVFVRVPGVGPPPDTTAPALTVPDDIIVDATSPAGAVVIYTATAVDDRDADPAVSCDPASGSTFSIGATTVTCTATDDAGNSAQASFTVTIRGAAEQINNLIDKVISALGLPPDLATTLSNRLKAAAAQVLDRSPQAACRGLTAFATALRAVSGRRVPPDLAAELITDADRIQRVLGCP